MSLQKDNIDFMEEGTLITFKDKSCTFIRRGNKLNRDGNTYTFNETVENPPK